MPFAVDSKMLEHCRITQTGRALQAAPQLAWSGKSGNVAAAQQAFLHRAEMNSLASLGKWTPELEQKGRTTAAA